MKLKIILILIVLLSPLFSLGQNDAKQVITFPVKPMPFGCNMLCDTVIDIGGWDMDGAFFKNVIHGLDYTKIRGIKVIVQIDGGTVHFPLNRYNSVGDIAGGVEQILPNLITLKRRGGGFFDNPTFSSTLINRGWVTITYE